MLDHPFLLGVAVEADDRAQPPRHRRPRLATVLELAGEALDVDAANLEQAVLTLPAPRRELAQIQRVGVTGVAAVAGEEPEQCCLLGFAHHRLIPLNRSSGSGHGQGPPCGRGRRPRPQRSKRPRPVKPGTYAQAPQPNARHVDADLVRLRSRADCSVLSFGAAVRRGARFAHVTRSATPATLTRAPRVVSQRSVPIPSRLAWNAAAGATSGSAGLISSSSARGRLIEEVELNCSRE